MTTYKFRLVALIVVSLTLLLWTGLSLPLPRRRSSLTRVAAQSIIVRGKPVGIETSGEESALLRSFSLPLSHTLSLTAPDWPSGMAFDFTTNQLLMVSEKTGTLYAINPADGTILRRIRLPGNSDADPGSYGIAVADGFWWHSDYQRLKLYKLAPATGEIIEALPMPARYLGVAWDGTNVWGVEPGDPRAGGPAKKMYRVDPKTGDILETIDLPDIEAPIDLTWDGANLWVVERDGLNFYQIDTSGNILRTETTVGQGGGIARQEAFMWVGDFDQRMLYRFNLFYSIHLPLALNFRQK